MFSGLTEVIGEMLIGKKNLKLPLSVTMIVDLSVKCSVTGKNQKLPILCEMGLLLSVLTLTCFEIMHYCAQKFHNRRFHGWVPALSSFPTFLPSGEEYFLITCVFQITRGLCFHAEWRLHSPISPFRAQGTPAMPCVSNLQAPLALLQCLLITLARKSIKDVRGWAGLLLVTNNSHQGVENGELEQVIFRILNKK